jgi:hypothetical protein
MTLLRTSVLRATRALGAGSVVLLLAAVIVVSVGQPAAAATQVLVTFEVAGAQGGGSGGGGGVVTATDLFDAGTEIGVHVGGSDGFNGGGAAGTRWSWRRRRPGAGGGRERLLRCPRAGWDRRDRLRARFRRGSRFRLVQPGVRRFGRLGLVRRRRGKRITRLQRLLPRRRR